MSSSPSVFVTGDAPIDAAVQRVLRWRFGARVADLAAVLDAGGIVAVPTESSYGLAVDPRRGDAVDAVFRIKGRDAGKALPVVIDASARLAALGIDPDQPAVRWAARHWPAALSVVLPLCLDAPPVPAALPPSPAMGEPAATLAVR
ncbi:MAG: Sua5/YciO/YrdC/YwlC family protein, partial [Acidobacteriota bacterium]